MKLTPKTTTMNLGSVKQMAYNLGLKKNPDDRMTRLSEQSHLLRRESEGRSAQRPVSDPPAVTEGAEPDVVSTQQPSDSVLRRPHSLTAVTYKFPTFCDFCGEMLYGLIRQGLRCNGCRLNFHKRCAHLIPNNCSRVRYSQSSMASSNPDPEVGAVEEETVLAAAASGSTKKRSSERWPTGRPAWLERELAGSASGPHAFEARSYRLPTMCLHCKRLLKGLYHQGMQCTQCRLNVHRRCVPKLRLHCEGDLAAKWAQACKRRPHGQHEE